MNREAFGELIQTYKSEDINHHLGVPTVPQIPL